MQESKVSPTVDFLLTGAPPALILEPNSAFVPPARPTLAPADVRALTSGLPLPPPRRKLLEGLVLLWHDHWDLSHELAQSHEGQADHDLLHAIGHRREGDYPNAEYWFRSAGKHPSLALLDGAVAAALPEGDPLRKSLLPSGHWSAKAFVTEVRRHVKETSQVSRDREDALIRVQALEFRVFAEWLLTA